MLQDLNTLPLQNGCVFPSAKSEVTMATIQSVHQMTTDDAVKRTLNLTLDISVSSFIFINLKDNHL